MLQTVERKIVLHNGVYKPTATTTEAVFMITGMTIGAGILGLPYAVAQVGIIPGLVIIATLGLVVGALNYLIGEVAMQTGDNVQLGGLAGKYLGRWAKLFLSVVAVLSMCGSLLAYVIAEGLVLKELLGGSELVWSIIFWSIGSFFLWGGVNRIKVLDKIIGLFVLGIIVLISLALLPHMTWANVQYIHGNHFLMPFGVTLFALHASAAIAEVHSVMPNSRRQFCTALIVGTALPVLLYMLFSAAVVGVAGAATAPVATVSIAQYFGTGGSIAANIFAALAMATCFMGVGTALKETLNWDYSLPERTSLFATIALPLTLFLLGLRSFVTILDVVGGVLVGAEALCMVAVYIAARRKVKQTNPEQVSIAWRLVLPIVAVFSFVTCWSIYSLMR